MPGPQRLVNLVLSSLAVLLFILFGIFFLAWVDKPRLRVSDLFVSSALAHEWYPQNCCSGKDCYAISPADLLSEGSGWRILRTNELIVQRGYSPDGQFHRCSAGGMRDARTLCLFIPLPSGS